MADYTKSTGATGTMMIRDTGTTVEFWLKAGSQTYNYDLPWAYIVNGYSSGWKEFRFERGGDWQKLGGWNVSYSQTVTFKLGNTTVSGLGGPTTFSVSIDRARVPNPPSYITLTNVTWNSAYATFSDGNNNGSSIDSRQIGYGTNSSSPQKTVYSDRSTVITGLVPGTKYYFWARTHNARGWSGWSPRRETTTMSIVYVKVGNTWKMALSYVRLNGVWKQARPFVRISGIWKETRG